MTPDLSTDRTLTRVADFVRWGASEFARAGLHFGHGTQNAADEAFALVCHVLHLAPDAPAYFLDAALTADERRDVMALIERRIAERKPLAYLTGKAYFAGLEFRVDENVIVPRSPMAELIERSFAPWRDPGSIRRVLDLCTGSGCIAIACAHYLPAARVDAVDLSAAALDVAAANVAAHGVEDRVRLVRGDLYEGLDGERYDVIVSNPPYVPDADVDALPAEFGHEPRMALAGGADGLDIVRRLLSGARDHLCDDGVLVVEVGLVADAVAETWPSLPMTWIEFERGGSGVFLLTAADLAAMSGA